MVAYHVTVWATVCTICTYYYTPRIGVLFLITRYNAETWKLNVAVKRVDMKMSGQCHAPVTLPPGKDTCYLLNGGLGGPKSRCEYL
jgi:hypothetical protein